MLPICDIRIYRVRLRYAIVIDVAPLRRLKHHATLPVERPVESRFLTFEILGRMVTRVRKGGIHRGKINRSIGLRREFIWQRIDR